MFFAAVQQDQRKAPSWVGNDAIPRDSLTVQDDWMHSVAALLNLSFVQRQSVSVGGQVDWEIAVSTQVRCVGWYVSFDVSGVGMGSTYRAGRECRYPCFKGYQACCGSLAQRKKTQAKDGAGVFEGPHVRPPFAAGCDQPCPAG